jgi:hypothetical protein
MGDLLGRCGKQVRVRGNSRSSGDDCAASENANRDLAADQGENRKHGYLTLWESRQRFDVQCDLIYPIT